MKPIDARLLRYARSTRAFLVVAVLLGFLVAILVIVQARLLSDVVVRVSSEGATWTDVSAAVLILAGIFAVRALTAWGIEVAAVRSSAKAKQELRESALTHIMSLGPAGPASRDPGGTATLITRGIDALDGYFSRYLPQLILAVIVPVAVLVTIFVQDLLSAIIVVVTLPLIPIFMVLIGMYTKARVDRQWRTLARLSGHFLDLVSGLPTLKAFGRAKSQAEAIRAIGDQYRSATMGVLKVSFLSSLALELLATLSVALVAVSVGLRLAEGQIQYSVALFVLVLAPEAYLPLRLVGQQFHAAAEGLGAADRLFTLLETPTTMTGASTLPEGRIGIVVENMQVTYPGRDIPAVSDFSFRALPGQVTAIVGSSGGGKSTILLAIMGLVPVSNGAVRASVGQTSMNIEELSDDAWRPRLAWLPQRSHLLAADLADEPTIAQVVALGKSNASDDEIRTALSTAGIDSEQLPEGIHTRLSADASGLSIGQQQRIALARALLTDADVYLLDEPTAALDVSTESAVAGAVAELAQRGATVIVVAHRPALVDVAHRVIRVEAPASETAEVAS